MDIHSSTNMFGGLFNGYILYIYRERDLNPLKPCLGTGEFFNFLSWQILQILEAEIRPVYCHNCQQLSRAEVLPDFFAVFGHHMTSYDMIHHTNYHKFPEMFKSLTASIPLTIRKLLCTLSACRSQSASKSRHLF